MRYQDRQTESGHLVLVKPGSYLTELVSYNQPAMVLLKEPVLGTVLGLRSSKSDSVSVLIQDDKKSTIVVAPSALTEVQTES